MSFPSCSICFEDLIPSKHKSRPGSKSSIDCELSGTGAGSSSLSSSQDATAAAGESTVEAPPANPDDVSTTPCGHVFHTHCVSQWVRQHRHCPQCRRLVLVSTLVRLFMTEYQRRGGLRRQASASSASDKYAEAGAGQPSSSSSSSSSPPPPVEAGGSSHSLTEEESRIIQDVLQCQLDDLGKEVQRMKELVTQLQDQLEAKVAELSSCELKLATSKQRQSRLQKQCQAGEELLRELKLKERQLRDEGAEVEQKLRREYECLTRDNDDLRSQVYKLREEGRKKDLQVRAGDQREQGLQRKVASLQAEVGNKAHVIAQLQTQLDNIHRLDDAYTIYESVDDLATSSSSPAAADRREAGVANDARTTTVTTAADKQKCSWRATWSCIKSFVLILFFLAILLAIFVVLPLKIIFSKTRL